MGQREGRCAAAAAKVRGEAGLTDTFSPLQPCHTWGIAFTSPLAGRLQFAKHVRIHWTRPIKKPRLRTTTFLFRHLFIFDGSEELQDHSTGLGRWKLSSLTAHSVCRLENLDGPKTQVIAQGYRNRTYHWRLICSFCMWVWVCIYTEKHLFISFSVYHMHYFKCMPSTIYLLSFRSLN